MRINSYNNMYNIILNQNKYKNRAISNQSTKEKSNVIVQGSISVNSKKSGVDFEKKIEGSAYIDFYNVDPSLYQKEDLKTGYDWIDNITLKRDTTGKMSKAELYELNRIKITLAQEQNYSDVLYENGRGRKERVDPNKYFDKDGYVKNGYTTYDIPKLERRENLNTKINDLLTSNGIEVTDKDELKFTIDAYNQVKVTGNADEEKLEAIAKILNDNKMGSQLVGTTSGIAYKHQRYTQIEYDKYSLNKDLQRYADLDLRDFEYNGETLVSKEDGRSILEIYCEAIDNAESVPDISKNHVKSTFSNTLKRVMNYGYEKIDDVKFEIGFVSNKLYDIDAVFGYGAGQTDWLENLHNSRGNIDQYNKYANEVFLELEKYEKYNQYATISK